MNKTSLIVGLGMVSLVACDQSKDQVREQYLAGQKDTTTQLLTMIEQTPERTTNQVDSHFAIDQAMKTGDDTAMFKLLSNIEKTRDRTQASYISLKYATHAHGIAAVGVMLRIAQANKDRHQLNYVASHYYPQYGEALKALSSMYTLAENNRNKLSYIVTQYPESEAAIDAFGDLYDSNLAHPVEGHDLVLQDLAKKHYVLWTNMTQQGR